MNPVFMSQGASPALPAAPDAAPPPLASLDRAFEVFRRCWRRAAFAQLALALVTLASTAYFTALLSLGGAAAVIRLTRSGGGWPERMAASVSARAWHTTGRVVPTRTIAALRTMSRLTLLAILLDLGTATWIFSVLFPFDTGTSSAGSPPSAAAQALFALSAIAYPILAIHLFVSFFSARAWLRDACEWLELLPRPAAPAAIWDLEPGNGRPNWAAQPLMESPPAAELADS